jgi:LDH2 family malate/lactate/ureidoglycolate dehydrogenase
LKETPKAKGAKRIYIHGEKEFEETKRLEKEGVPLNSKVIEDLRSIAKQLGMNKPF